MRPATKERRVTRTQKSTRPIRMSNGKNICWRKVCDREGEGRVPKSCPRQGILRLTWMRIVYHVMRHGKKKKNARKKWGIGRTPWEGTVSSKGICKTGRPAATAGAKRPKSKSSAHELKCNQEWEGAVVLFLRPNMVRVRLLSRAFFSDASFLMDRPDRTDRESARALSSMYLSL